MTRYPPLNIEKNDAVVPSASSIFIMLSVLSVLSDRGENFLPLEKRARDRDRISCVLSASIFLPQKSNTILWPSFVAYYNSIPFLAR